MTRAFAQIAFTPHVKAFQQTHGSANSYAKFLEPEAPSQNKLSSNETSFIQQRDGFYQATISETGWPYVQFRGGSKGFLSVIDETTLAYADFRGNRQYLSSGNLVGEDRISLILMDYPNQRRLKIWGTATLKDINDHSDFIEKLMPTNYRATPERAVQIKIEAFDWNCPQHIPVRLTQEEMAPYLSEIEQQLKDLKQENKELKNELNKI